MVYCNLISKDVKFLKYAIGGTPEDLTGELLVDLNNLSFNIVKEPEKTRVYSRHIGAMLRRALPDYKKGVFKDRLSYEI